MSFWLAATVRGGQFADLSSRIALDQPAVNDRRLADENNRLKSK
jgi:hypothetical protein